MGFLNMRFEIQDNSALPFFIIIVGAQHNDEMGMMNEDFPHQPGKEYINKDTIATRGAFVARKVLEILRDEEQVDQN